MTSQSVQHPNQVMTPDIGKRDSEPDSRSDGIFSLRAYTGRSMNITDALQVVTDLSQPGSVPCISHRVKVMSIRKLALLDYTGNELPSRVHATVEGALVMEFENHPPLKINEPLR